MGKGRDARRKFRNRGVNVDYAERQAAEIKDEFSKLVESTAGLTAENIRLSAANARLEKLVESANYLLSEHEKNAGSLIAKLAGERDEEIQRFNELLTSFNSLQKTLELRERANARLNEDIRNLSANLSIARRDVSEREAELLLQRRRVRELEAELLLERLDGRSKTASTVPFDLKLWRRVVALVHPDKHPTERASEANEVTMQLIKMKPK